MAPPKAKGQKMGLGEFLTDASLGSWADEMEDAPLPPGRSGYGGERSYNAGGIGNASYADRGYSVRESLPLPTKPPYTVHLGNMSFDATEGDIQDFFAGCHITSVRIVEDKIDRKPKGFGYAEFATIDGLKKALEANGSQFQGRNIRVSVAEPQKDRSEARELNDWTRKGPLPDLAPKRSSEKSQFGGRGSDFAPESGSDRQTRRPAYEQGDGKTRDFSNWERKGPLTSNLPAPTPAVASRHFDRPTSRDGHQDRRGSPAWGEGRSQEGSRPPRREFAERPAPERAQTAAELDNQWRLKMRPDPPPPLMAPTSSSSSTKDFPRDSSPKTAVAAPAVSAQTGIRPKLNLQKRTVSQADPSPGPNTAATDSKASPFGAARPIDTSAREKEIEEKMRQRREAEEKAREEKRIADEKIKEEKRAAKEAERAKEKPNGSAKESETPKNYQILRRETGEEDDAAQKETLIADSGEDANGVAADDKQTKPHEIVRQAKDATSAPSNDASSANQLEDEGWSTVSKPTKSRKSTNAGGRAIAS